MSKKHTLFNRSVFSGLVAFLTALTVLILTAGTSANSAATGITIYRTVWQRTQEKFVFTDRLKDWSQWEHKFDDKIKSQDDGIKYANEMLASINDKYTRVFDESETQKISDSLKGKFVGIGVRFVGRHDAKGELMHKDEAVLPLADAEGHPMISKVLKETPASGAGLKDRDVILQVNNKSTAGMALHQIVENIVGPEGSTVALEIKRGEQRLSVKVPRRKFDIEAVSFHSMPNNLGYIRIDSFMSPNTADQCLRALKSLKTCRGYILDLRSNPGGQLQCAREVASLFQDSGIVYSVRERVDNYISAGQAATDNSIPHVAAKKPLVILVNNDTASAAEIVAGALHDNRKAKLIGCRTYGKGLVQGVYKITDRINLNVTIAQWLTPSGVCPGSDTKTEHPNGLPVEVTCNNGPYFELDSERDNQLKTAAEVLSKEPGLAQ